MRVILKPRVVLLAAVALVLVGAGAFMARLDGASAAGGGPEIRLTANGCTAECTFATGESFTLAVEVVTAPAAGYVGAQSFIDYGGNLIYDIDGQLAADEIVWADCAPAIALRSQVTPESISHSCLSGLVPPLPASTFVGNIVELSLTCSSASSTTTILLVASGVPAPTAFVLEDLVTQVTPKVSNLTVTCDDGEDDDDADEDDAD